MHRTVRTLGAEVVRARTKVNPSSPALHRHEKMPARPALAAIEGEGDPCLLALVAGTVPKDVKRHPSVLEVLVLERQADADGDLGQGRGEIFGRWAGKAPQRFPAKHHLPRGREGLSCLGADDAVAAKVVPVAFVHVHRPAQAPGGARGLAQEL